MIALAVLWVCIRHEAQRQADAGTMAVLQRYLAKIEPVGPNKVRITAEDPTPLTYGGKARADHKFTSIVAAEGFTFARNDFYDTETYAVAAIEADGAVIKYRLEYSMGSDTSNAEGHVKLFWK